MILVAPIAILAIWGLSYLRDVYEVLKAPGVPVELKYVSEAGVPGRIRAESYTLDLKNGTLRLSQLSFVAGDAEALAKLDSAEITGLNALYGADQVLRVHARNLDARLLRRSTGRFEIEDLLPKREEPSADIPFEAVVENIKVDLIDLAGDEWRETLRTPRLTVAGIGDNWIAHGSGLISGMGQADARIQSIEGFGISILASTPEMELAGLINHLTTTKDLETLIDVRNASASSVVVRGPVQLFLPVGEGARIESSLTAELLGLRYNEYSLDSATFRGLLTDRGAVGELVARSGGNTADVQGSMRWDETQRFAGNVDVRSPSPQNLPAWLRTYLPREATYRNGRFVGWVSYYPDSGARASGRATAANLTYAGEQLSNAVAQVRYSQDEAVVRLENGTIRGQNARGVVAYNTRSGALSGSLDTLRLDMAAVIDQLNLTGLDGLTGVVTVSATLAGTAEAPVVAFNASGSGKYAYQTYTIPLDAFQASGLYGSKGLTLTRAIVNSSAGLLTASGTVSPSGALDLDVMGRGIRPRLVDDRLGGSANMVASVTGTIENPVMTGSVEGYALTYNSEILPAAVAEFTANRNEVVFQDFEAVRGSAVIEGSGRFIFNGQRIHADMRASGIQIADLLGPDFVGAVEVPSLELTGTIERPLVTGLVRGQNLLVRGVKVDQFSARIQTVDDTVQLQDTFANFAGGAVTATGGYNIATRSGTISFSGSTIELAQLLPEFAAYVQASGQVSGSGTVTISDGELKGITGEGQLQNIVVNNTAVGSGPWSFSTAGNLITGNVEIGQLDRYVTLQNFEFNTETEAVDGNLDFFNVHLEDLVAISLRYLPADLSYETLRTIHSVKGRLSLSADLGGTLANINADVPTLEATQLSFRDTEFESLTANFQRQDQVWTIRNATLLGDPTPTAGVGRRGQARYDLQGLVDEHGDVDVSGDFTNVALSEFSALVPWFTGKTGEANLSFALTGPVQSPVMQATLLAQGLLGELDPDLIAEIAQAEAAGGLTEDQRARFYDKTLSINLYEIRVSEGFGAEQGISIAGDYSYTGFQGQIQANVPFAYPFTIPSDQPASGELTLRERSLTEIAGLLNILDPARTAGTVQGRISANGTPSNIMLSGGVNVQAERFAFDIMDDPVNDLTAFLNVEPNRLVLSADATSSRAGTVAANVTVPIDDLGNIAEAIQSGFGSTLLDSPVTGFARLEGLEIRQTLFGTGSVRGVFTGDLTLAGTLREPLVEGTAAIAGMDTQMPTIEAGDTEREEPTVNPSFNIEARLSDPAHIRASGADLWLLGSGTLRGTLQYPNVAADLYVDRGNVRLPGGNIRLEQGGSVDLRYEASSVDVFSSLQVDIEGRTVVTAPRFGDILERYDVTINIRGDLLREGGLAMTASSDPPDLSQDRILALLGQTELISGLGSGLAGGGFAGDTERRLRGALLGYALPILFDPVTSGIAKSLGLDYLSLEYNVYEQASLVFARPLGNNWSLQGRRQITPPPPGFPYQYDVRLVYRPRRLPGILNRFSLSIGADELRPWKIAIEYGTRF